MANHTDMNRSKSTGKKETRIPDARDEYGEIQVVLDDFCEALTAGDTEGIIELFELPATVVGEDVMAITSFRDLEKLFGGAKKAYNERGISDTRGDILSVDWINDRVAMVDVRFPWLDANREEIGSESSTYTFRRDDEGELRLRVIHMRGASQPS